MFLIICIDRALSQHPGLKDYSGAGEAKPFPHRDLPRVARLGMFPFLWLTEGQLVWLFPKIRGPISMILIVRTPKTGAPDLWTPWHEVPGGLAFWALCRRIWSIISLTFRVQVQVAIIRNYFFSKIGYFGLSGLLFWATWLSG